MLKRYLSVCFAAVVLAVVVGACGGSDENSSSSSSGSSDSSTQANSGAKKCDPKIADFDTADVHLSYYAIENGLVTDPRVGKVNVDYLALPALLQATGSDRYDVTSTSLSGVVFARTRAKKDFKVIAFKQASNPGGHVLWTQKSSGIASPKDLKGKRIGTTSLASTSTMMLQMVLKDKYGLNAALTGGDVKWTELDPPTLLKATQKGQVDGGELFYDPNYAAMNDPSLKSVMDISAEYKDLTGARFVGGALMASPDALTNKRDCMVGLQKMLGESAAYAKDHLDELAPKVAKASNTTPEYLKFWFKYYDYGNSVDDQWTNDAVAFWDKAKEEGFLPVTLTAQQAVFRPDAGS